MEAAEQHLFYLVGPPDIELIGFAQAETSDRRVR
jgi:hypothetical protein